MLGFALEVTEDRPAALGKLRAKQSDWIVLNRAEAIGSDVTSVEVLDAGGRVVLKSAGSKEAVADELITWLNTAVPKPKA